MLDTMGQKLWGGGENETEETAYGAYSSPEPRIESEIPESHWSSAFREICETHCPSVSLTSSNQHQKISSSSIWQLQY